MPLTPAQDIILKADILSPLNAAALQVYIDNIDDQGIANWYNDHAIPDYWVWKTFVTKAEITGQLSPDGTTWNWTAYIARSQGERDGWREMFDAAVQSGVPGGGQQGVNASLPNVRQGFQDIFSGGANNAPAQRAHLAAIGRRLANRVEKLFATGAGSTGNPSTLTFEGKVTALDIARAWRGVGA